MVVVMGVHSVQNRVSRPARKCFDLDIITLEFRFYYEKRAGIFPVMPNPQGRHYEEAIYRADYDSTVFHYACPIGQA